MIRPLGVAWLLGRKLYRLRPRESQPLASRPAARSGAVAVAGLRTQSTPLITAIQT
jgi:hypothetical protein